MLVRAGSAVYRWWPEEGERGKGIVVSQADSGDKRLRQENQRVSVDEAKETIK